MNQVKSKILVLAISLFVALGVMAQQNATVNVVMQNATIGQVLNQMKSQTHVNFIYSNEDVRNLPSRSYNLTGKTIPEVLSDVLKNTNLEYSLVNGAYVIRQKASGSYITGTVIDETGMPVIGASVVINGTTEGSSTDLEGKFSIPSKGRNEAKLTVSYIGMDTQQLTWKKRPLNIVLVSTTSQLDEMVVTGYQILDKRSITSAVSSIKAEDILRSDVPSIDQMLEGQVPDLMLTTNSGEVGVTPRIRIRGTSSLIGNREPLWVVDGIIVTDPVNVSSEELNDPDYINRIGNAIAGLNPRDIERLDILKDAAATALYGTRAANGVIVITTKRGREGKMQVQYNNSLTWKFRPRYSDPSVNLMNSKERIAFSRELLSAHYQYPPIIANVGYEYLVQQLYSHTITQAEFDAQVAQLEVNNTDWLGLLCHDSFSHQHTVSFSGGSSAGRYYASLGYNRADDVIKGNDNNRYTAVINFDTNITKWLTALFSINANVSERKYYIDEVAPMDYAYNASRVIPAYTPEGEYSFYQKNYQTYYGYMYNILNELDNSGYDQRGSAVTFNTNLKFRLTDWLNANAIFSYTATSTDMETYWGAKTYHMTMLRGSEYGSPAPSNSIAPQGGEMTTNGVRNNNYTARLQLDAFKEFGNDIVHGINGSIGYELNSGRYRGNKYTMRGYYPDRGETFVADISTAQYPEYANWLATNVPIRTNTLSNTMSLYATATYNYNRLFYLNANMRVDGSNNFGDQSNHKFLPVWSVSGSFDFSKLEAIQNAEWIDFLTMKTSYGYQGNMLTSESPVMIIHRNPMNNYFGDFTSSISRYPNPDLRWEKTSSYNLGFEFSLFHNRIQFEGNYYYKYTKDAFMSKTISTVNGLSSTVINGGNVSNNGYSIAITLNPIMNKDWRWTLSTSFSKSFNKVESTPAAETYNLRDFLNGTALVDGQPVGTFYSYKFLGLSPVDGGPMFDDYEDRQDELNELSKYDTYTKVLVPTGKREPDIAGGLNTSLRYKNFRLSASFAYSAGASTRLFGMYTDVASTTMNANEFRPEYNVSRDYLDRWQHPGDEANTIIPGIVGVSSPAYYKYNSHWSTANYSKTQPIANNYWDMYDYSDARVVSADYFKCNSVSFTYEFPINMIRNWGLSRLALTASGYNLFTIADSRLKGQTPTQGGFTQVTLSNRPSVSVGLDVTF